MHFERLYMKFAPSSHAEIARGSDEMIGIRTTGGGKGQGGPQGLTPISVHHIGTA